MCGGPTDYLTPPRLWHRDGPTIDKLANVDYRGRVGSDEAHEVIANAALLLCTSDEEGFPNTVYAGVVEAALPILTLQVDPDSIIEKFGLGAVSRTVNVCTC